MQRECKFHVVFSHFIGKSILKPSLKKVIPVEKQIPSVKYFVSLIQGECEFQVD